MIPNFVMPENTDPQISIRMEPEALSDTAIIIHLIGFIDTYNSDFFAKQMQAVIDAGYTKIVLGCSGLNYVSSTGVGAFTAILKTLGKSGTVAIAEMSYKVSEVFQLLGFSSFFRIFDTMDSAKAFIQNVESGKPESTTTVFPKTISCPICNKKLKISKAGVFRCPECKTGIVVDETGNISLK